MKNGAVIEQASTGVTVKSGGILKKHLAVSKLRFQHFKLVVQNPKDQFLQEFTVMGRAVTRLPEIADWLRGKITDKSRNMLPNGLIYLKGGDIKDEFRETKCANQVWEFSDFFREEFFGTKKIARTRLGG